MNFIRRNLFFVILGGTVLVLMVASIIVNAGPAGRAEEELALRKATAGKLLPPPKSGLVNEGIVEEERKSVLITQKEFRELVREFIEWNRKPYRILELPLLDSKGVETGKVNAFPIDAEQYSKYSLNYRFTEKYLEELEAMRAKLGPATVPTQEQVTEAAARIEAALQRDLDRQKALRDKKNSGAGGGPADEGKRKVDEETVAALAKRQARVEVMAKHAAGGRIYVDPQALRKIWPKPDEKAGVNDMWIAQVQLWVFGDVVEAIHATNQAVFSAAGGRPTVLNAGIKRLKAFSILRTPFQGRESAAREKAARAASTADNVRRLVGRAKNLTGRNIGPQYDVIHYTVQVVMPLRHVLTLQRDLLRRGAHTILNVRIGEVAREAEDLHYYGQEPVMDVTMDGELLLLTAWGRGSPKDAEPAPAKPESPRARSSSRDRRARGRAGQPEANSGPIVWKEGFPPLMPVEVLEVIGAKNPLALRQVDARRLKLAGKGKP